MLVKYDGSLRYVSSIFANFFAITLVISTPLYSNPPEMQYQFKDIPPENFGEYAWAVRYLQSVNENTSLEEMIDFLVSLRSSIIEKGHRASTLSELWLNIQSTLGSYGIFFDKEDLATITDIIDQKEHSVPISFNGTQFSIRTIGAFPPIAPFFSDPQGRQAAEQNYKEYLQRHPEKAQKNSQKRKEPNHKTVVGVVCMFAGALLCIIPHPITYTAGSALASYGFKECMDGVAEKSEENAKKQNEGPLANPPAEHDPSIYKNMNFTGSASLEGVLMAINPAKETGFVRESPQRI